MRFYPGFRLALTKTDLAQDFEVFRWKLYVQRLKSKYRKRN